MKSKFIKTTLPTVLGVMTVLGILLIFNLIFHNGDVFTSSDNGFFKYFVPLVTLFAMIIQFLLTIPLFEKFKIQKKVLGLTLFQFSTLLSIISGLAFGLLFWESNFGIKELIYVSLTGIIAFTVYWTINLLILKKLSA